MTSKKELKRRLEAIDVRSDELTIVYHGDERDRAEGWLSPSEYDANDSGHGTVLTIDEEIVETPWEPESGVQ